MRRRDGIRRLLRLRPANASDVMREVDEELRLHVELRQAELERAGVPAAEAGTAARRLLHQDAHSLRELYSTAIERERHMDTRERWGSVIQDVRYALRGIVREPALSGFMVLTLALGIGANITSFSLLDRLLLRPPAHVVEPDALVRLYGTVERDATGANTSSWIPYPAYAALRDNMSAFAAVGVYRVQERQLERGLDSRKARIGQATGSFFHVLGVQPLQGRLFRADEDALDAGQLAILSEDTWRERYGGGNVVGRTLLVDDVPHTIIGVAPAGFTGVEPRRVEAWVLASSRTAGTQNWNIVGRLRNGVNADAASVEATSIHERTGETSQEWFRGARLFAAPLHYGDDGAERVEATMARWLAGVSAVILLVALANVVNLLLVRMARRRRELAIRISLGSGRGRVMRLIAVEGALLALVSGAASLLVAAITEPVVRRALFADEAGWSFDIADLRVVGIVTGIVMLTALVVGIVPALQAGDPQLVRALRGGARGGASSSRARAALTIVQAALSVALLAGAGLFLRSLANVAAVDLGVDSEHVIAAEAQLPPLKTITSASIREFFVTEADIYRRLEQVVRELPGVTNAAVAIGLPLDGGSFSAGAHVPGMDSVPTLPGGGPYVSTVTAGYFDVVGTTLLRGRAFTSADREGSEPVVIINETMARTLWPAGNAVDACFHIGSRDNPCARIVGVVEDVNRTGLEEQASLQYYIPVGQQSMFGGAQLLVRASPDAPVSAQTLREAMLRVDPAIRGVEIRALGESLEGEIRPLRLGMVTFGMSALLALLVAVLGLYSIMSHMVAWRTHEIGVRVALGATRGGVIALVLRNGLVLAGAGVAIGLVLAVISGRWLEPHLFHTSARDTLILATVALTLMITAVVAGWLPARRATRISPTEALRTE